MLKGAMVELAIRKYKLPQWMKPYIMSYLRGNDMSAIKFAASYINVGRKKGSIARNEIRLPNGKVFKKEHIAHILNLFYYGEVSVCETSKLWSETHDRTPDHVRHFRTMCAVEEKRARTIRNLMLGLGYRIGKPTPELIAVFDYIKSLTDWDERLFAKKILLNYSYAKPFGYVFYKAFYPVQPEYMRTFGKAFTDHMEEETLSEKEAEDIIREKRIGYERLMEITEHLLMLILRSVNAELPTAKRAGIEREIVLLRDISLAYPLHRLEELGVDMDVQKEITYVKMSAR